MGRKLNTSTPTVIQTELVPLDENFAIEANGTLEQWYYDNTTQYAPDRSITPLILSPKIMVADKDSQQSWDDAHVTKSVVAWSVMESNTWVDITSSSVLSDYELSGNNLIVHKNVSYSQGVTIMCKLTYVDPRDNGIYITTQETVLLTCNRDANVVLPEVAITSPSARSFNPLVDGASTEYDFDAVVTNSPDVEMQSSDIATYEMDGSGTEEIISDTNGIAPILDIRYPDSETQFNQEFAYRQTANGEKADETGAAFISKIKGNTVAWNQLIVQRAQGTTTGNGVTIVSNGDGSYTVSTVGSGATALAELSFAPQWIKGHKYLIKGCPPNGSSTTYFIGTGWFGEEYGNGLIVTDTKDSVSYWPRIIVATGAVITTPIVFWPQMFDLTLIYGEGNEPTTVAQFEADYERWFGKPLSYEEYDEGSLRPVLMQSVKTTGFNQWDEELLQGFWNLVIGEMPTLSYHAGRVCSANPIKVIPNKEYCFKSSMQGGASYWAFQIAFLDSERRCIDRTGWINPDASNAYTFSTPSNCAYILIPTMYAVVNNVQEQQLSPNDYNHDICINISDSSKNGTYEPYKGHIASVPVTSAKGKLLDASGNPTGNTVTIFPDGLKKAGNIQDEIFVEDGVVKATKRIGVVDLGNATWNYYSTCFQADNLVVGNIANANAVPKAICAKYVPEIGVNVVQGTAADKSFGFSDAAGRVFVKDLAYSDAATFKAAMQGVMLYYELATPETYVLDPVQNPFIYKWFGIDANNNEVLAETLPWYVSGQDTSKLRVDAMFGEKINVVLRAMMPTGALSPSKAYAALTWRIPDVDTTVVSYNGSAVRSDTNSMTFGTIVNINGRNLEDSVKAANLRFKWVYRKNFTSQETVAGWSQGESDQITIQASNLRSVRAQDSTLTSTLVFPYVYCLGAWTTSQGTETGYSKPTTTKNGVTYYRIVD